MPNRKVLLIDDDVTLLGVVSRMLERGGYEVVGASDGKRGLELVGTEQPDLVITDLLMPEIEGIETIQRLRESHPALPILAISGSFEGHEFSALEDARLMGADATLPKPFTVEQLLGAVRALLP